MRSIFVLLLPCCLRLTAAFSIKAPLSLLPEDVVRQQLNAFQSKDIKTAFSYASPENRAATGPSWQEFDEMIMSQDDFSPILGHFESTVLMIVSPEEWESGCLVRIVPKEDSKKCFEYWWELTKREEGDEMEGCWMVDSVLPNFESMSLDWNDEIFDSDGFYDYEEDDYEE
jgi:hypothetical protein